MLSQVVQAFLLIPIWREIVVLPATIPGPWTKRIPILHQQCYPSSCCWLILSPDDSQEYATPLSLTLEDHQCLEQLQNSQWTVPIMILDSMLPKQKLSWQSMDPKFCWLIQYCLSDDNSDGNEDSHHVLSIVGLNPHTGCPLCHGVMALVTNNSVHITDNIDGSKNALIHIMVMGQELRQVQGEPWLNDSKCFYLANVEIVKHWQKFCHLSKSKMPWYCPKHCQLQWQNGVIGSLIHMQWMQLDYKHAWQICETCPRHLTWPNGHCGWSSSLGGVSQNSTSHVPMVWFDWHW